MKQITEKFEAFFSSEEEKAEQRHILEISKASERKSVPITVQTVVVTEQSKTIEKEEVHYV